LRSYKIVVELSSSDNRKFVPATNRNLVLALSVILFTYLIANSIMQ